MLNATTFFSRRALLAACGFLTFASFTPAQAAGPDITVFAAASMKGSLDDVNAAFTKQTGTKVVVSFASSSALAKQMEQGAPADIFISADLQWMDYVDQRKLIKADSRTNLLGNRLVMVASSDSKLSNVVIDGKLDLEKLSGGGRIATGDVRAVPAGLYAKAALEKLGLWTVAEPKLAMAENVRAALALVSRGEAPLGIVYATDAAADPKVKVVGTFPADSHPAIIYPVAMTEKTPASTAAYLTFLRSDAAKAIFTKYGFSIIATGS